MICSELLKPSETIRGDCIEPKETGESYPRAWQCLVTSRKTGQDIFGNAGMGGLAPIRRILQTLLLPTSICFDRWHAAWLISISALRKKSKNGSFRGSPQKTHCFFEMVCHNCHKDGNKVVPSDKEYFEL